MQRVVILGTGGTIAGTNDDPARPWSYQAAQLSVAQLVQAIPSLQGLPLEAIQVAQIDSKDMGWSVWQQLGQALAVQLARDDVAGVVITHGTDTLEETAYLLHRLHDGRKPVVLTAAMRPATAVDADGPRNVRDAVRVVLGAAERRLGGVVAVMAGQVWAGCDVRKAHSHQVDAFDGGGAQSLLTLDETGLWQAEQAVWPESGGAGWGVLTGLPPRVEVVMSHADADGWLVQAALAFQRTGDPLRGLVVAGTGHGTVHQGLQAALDRAKELGVVVWRSSRVARGGVQAREGQADAAGALTAAQARVALVLYLMGMASSGA